MPLVSVIVPVYNSEKYLDRCLGSICSQTHHELEIILVNDGSVDESLQICSEWAGRDDRIRIIDRDNAGAASARNAALGVCTGEFVCFVDSDDEIDSEAAEEALKAAIRDNSELVLYGMEVIGSGDAVLRRYVPAFPEQSYRGDETRNTVLYSMLMADETGVGGPSASCCVNLYRTSFLKENGWHFRNLKEVFSEDVYATLELYRSVNTVSVIDKPFYRYYMNDASSSHTSDPDRYMRMGRFYDDTRSMYSDNMLIRDHIAYIMLGFIIGEAKNIARASENAFFERKKHLAAFMNGQSIRRIIADIRPHELNKISKKIFYFMIKYKMYALCEVMLRAKKD